MIGALQVASRIQELEAELADAQDTIMRIVEVVKPGDDEDLVEAVEDRLRVFDVGYEHLVGFKVLATVKDDDGKEHACRVKMRANYDLMQFVISPPINMSGADRRLVRMAFISRFLVRYVPLDHVWPAGYSARIDYNARLEKTGPVKVMP